MRFMLRGRRNGKTNDAISWLLADPEHRAIVTHSEVEAERVRRLITEKLRADRPANVLDELEQPNVWSVSMGLRRSWGNGIEVRIDNLDLVLQALFGNVEGAYATIPLLLGQQFIDTGSAPPKGIDCEACGHTKHVGRCHAPLYRDVQLGGPADIRTEIYATCGCTS